MEAKNTVMTWKQTVECSHNPVLELRIEAIKEAQAEISFKAGKLQGAIESVDKLIVAGRKQGIREVVEWISEHTFYPGAPGANLGFASLGNDYIIGISGCKWKAKLKEWGINS